MKFRQTLKHVIEDGFNIKCNIFIINGYNNSIVKLPINESIAEGPSGMADLEWC
jgi:hypothetical protein